MISKKILVLVLALSVIVCGLPAFSVSATEEVQSWPDVAETLVNPSAWFISGFQFNLKDASEGLRASASNGLASSGGMTISGTVTFGKVTVNLNNIKIETAYSTAGTLGVYGSNFATHDPVILEAIKSSDTPDLDRDANGVPIVATSGTDANKTIKNFVRYVMYTNGESYIFSCTAETRVHFRKR